MRHEERRMPPDEAALPDEGDLPTSHYAKPASSQNGPPRLTVEEKGAELKVRRRDCRSCRAFRPDESGMSFGWCTAFEQYVKLYHPAGGFYSQCQFKVLARTPCTDLPSAADGQAAPEPAPPIRRPGWAPVPVTDGAR